MELHELREAGIIPALAGNTKRNPVYTAMGWDHPRSRGEYPWPFRSNMKKIGSSPLSRGIPKAVIHHCGKRRIIPALAGNTGSATQDAPSSWWIIPALAGNTLE